MLSQRMKLIPAFMGAFILYGSLLAYLLYGENLWPLTASQLYAVLLFGMAAGLLFLPLYFVGLSRIRWAYLPAIRFMLSVSVLASISWAMLYFCLQLAFAAGNPTLWLNAAVLCLLVAVFFTLGDFSWFAYYRYAAETLSQLQSQHRQRRLQFALLCGQLTPHYLFNSLNTASNLISLAPEKAETYLRQLARNLHDLLQQPNHQLATVGQELEIAERYFQLMEVRFGDKIRLENTISPKTHTQLLPVLSLQLLLENAIKHNVASSQQPLNIRLSDTPEGIWVENNLTQAPQHLHTGKLGLTNLKERYALLSHKQFRVMHSEQQFCIFLPFVPHA